MATHESTLFPVYVWELPVRIWHWVMAGCLLVLGITGYLIGSPPPTLAGEASDHYLFGYIRFAHFAAAYLFAVMFVLRLIWAVVGNRFARELFAVPRDMFRGAWWKGLFSQMRYYLFLQREAEPWQGHNPLAAAGMFFMYVLGAVFMTFVPEALRLVAHASSQWFPGVAGLLLPMGQVVFGVLIIGFLIFEPRRLFGIWIRIRSYWKSWPFSY